MFSMTVTPVMSMASILMLIMTTASMTMTRVRMTGTTMSGMTNSPVTSMFTIGVHFAGFSLIYVFTFPVTTMMTMMTMMSMVATVMMATMPISLVSLLLYHYQ